MDYKVPWLKTQGRCWFASLQPRRGETARENSAEAAPTRLTVTAPVVNETADTSTSVANSEDDGDDTLDYFSKLAEED